MSRTAHHGIRRERTENRPSASRFVFVDAAHTDDLDASTLSVAERVAAAIARRDARRSI